MALEQEQRAAMRILEGIEEGTMSAADSYALVEDADPALVYLIVTWLRKRYADHVNADAVIGRLVEVSSRPKVAKLMKEGQEDPVVEWFEESYSYKKLEKQEFIELNADLAEVWPNITERKEPLADAEEWDGVKDKLQYLER